MKVAVVSQTFVRQFLGERDPIGEQFARNEKTPAITIVGVVGEVRRDGKTAEITPQVYIPDHVDCGRVRRELRPRAPGRLDRSSCGAEIAIAFPHSRLAFFFGLFTDLSTAI